MDIQKEKDAYLGELLEREVITQDEFRDLVFKPEINAFDSNYLSSRFIDKINFGWSAWQAKAQAVPEGFVLVPREMHWHKADDLAYLEWDKHKSLFCSENRDLTALQVEEFRLCWCRNKANKIMGDYKAMIEAQEPTND